MTKILFFPIKVVLHIILFVPLLMAEPVAQPTLAPDQLIKALQSGGHIIYMRHSSTQRDQKDQMENTLESCDNQRNLSEVGRGLARTIGQTMASLDIPIGTILTSPFCRSIDTAQLAFGRYQIEDNLKFSMSKDVEESKFLSDKLLNMMIDTPAEGPNSVFVGHTSNLRDSLGVWPKPEAVIAIFQKSGDELTYKGMIKPTDWTDVQGK
jgi:phosphohistidine phosphatase SixA